MPTTSSTQHLIGRICAGPGDSRGLREEVLEALRPAVRFDAHVWVVTDPVTTVGFSPVAHVPSFDDLPTTISLRYRCAANRWTVLARDGRRVGLLSRSGDATSPGTREWTQFLAGHGIGDVATVVFADRFGVWAFLDLWRSGAEPFSDGEVDVLSQASVRVTTALRQRTAQTFDVPSLAVGRDLGPVVVVLDSRLRVVSQTPASDTWLERLLPPVPGRAPVPASVYNAAAQLLALEAGVDDHPPEATGHLGDGLWVTVRAARLRAGDGAEGHDSMIAVTIQEAGADERAAVFGRAHGLSERERELLGHLGRGPDTRELARDLGISHFTVQDHLKSVFAKTGAPTRQVLVARATGRS